MLRIFRQYYPIRNIFFVIGESLFIYNSVLVANWILSGWGHLFSDHWLFLKILLIAFVCQACLYYNDLYDLNVTDNFSELGVRLLQSLGCAAIFLSCIYLVFPQTIIRKGVFILSVGFAILFIVSWRFCYTVILNRGMFNKKIIILGSSDLAKSIISEIANRKDCGYTVAGIIAESYGSTEFKMKRIFPDDSAEFYEECCSSLCETAGKLGVEKIVVAPRERRGAFSLEELLKCRVEGIEVLEGNSFYEMLTGRLLVDYINPSWLIYSEGFAKNRTRRFMKRSMDFILSSIMLLILLPLIIITAILIKIDSRGPVLFSQERVGERKKTYRIHKFRSMVVNEGKSQTETDDVRITSVGKYIRKLHIDELPQLWNVLKGEMSIVGPRPEQEHFVEDFENKYKIPYYRERFTVKPGITGWAQINYDYGAEAEGAKEKLTYDLFYIKNMSTFMDMLIMLRTVKTVLFTKGSR
ncbi:MAG: TIGR03013 family PEP-CTERM/XrtA system glycosyltransferase [Desulfobacteraceae bacterium]|nr:TIGR03013 family PEP-CTERM/XrtA system glycosyltransferase [Desulfobacteraceae bacterium]